MAYFAPVIPALDLTYTYTRVVPRGNSGGVPINPGSLWDYLNESPKHKIFRHLVSIAQLSEIFNDQQAEVTVFVPDDELLLKKFPRNVFINMEKHQARRMIEYNTLPRLINMKELLSSGSMKLNTRIRGQVIYTQVKGSHENPTLFLNMTSRVVRPNLIVGNALIHVTDAFVVPEM
jgi:uncharacterized surface protein with fasciclin (FAS1) repeats